VPMAARDHWRERDPEGEPERSAAPVTGGAELLALQRTAGNRAVTAMLQRYSLEGPWNKGDPVHEVLTLRAIADALAKVKAEGKTAGSLLGGVDTKGIPELSSKKGHNLAPQKLNKSLHQFIRGVVWPDDPKGLLFDEPSGLTNYSSGAAWYEEFDIDEIGDPAALIARSHYGDLQFFHAMASSDGEKPGETKAKITKWSRFLIDVSTGRIDANKTVAEFSTAKELFPSHTTLTIKALFGYAKASDDEVRQRAAGALMHMIQDSHAKGHAERDASGDITEFHAYGSQDHAQHATHDAWASGADLGKRIKNTAGAERAIEKCKDVLVLLDQGASTDDVLKYLDAEVLKLAPGATAAGPGAGLEKSK
jgi:hypothetical protein